jgi:2-hydroxychromene-2-carboxylate isomerase
VTFARRVFAAFFVEGRDIAQEDVLRALAIEAGIAGDAAAEDMKAGRPLLERAVNDAIADKVVGSPFFLVDGEGFFGADRLPQLRWYLGRA